MVWYSHLLKNFPVCCDPHIQRLSVDNEAEVDVFLEFSCFLSAPTDTYNIISGSSAFSKSSLNIWKFLVHKLLKPSLKELEHYLVSMRNEQFDHSSALAFFEIAIKTDLSSPVATVEFSKFAGILSGALNSLIFQDFK